MADKKKETKKILIVDDDVMALRSDGASGVVVAFSFASLMAMGGLATGYCHATPWCSNGVVGLAKAFIAPQRGGEVVASGPNFAPAIRPKPALTSVSTAVAAKPPLDARDVYEQAQRDLLQQVFDPKLWQSAVRLGEIVNQSNADGTYDVRVPLSWSIDPALILRALDPYFSDVNGLPLRVETVDFSGRMGQGVRGIVVSRPFNRGEAQKQPYTERLYDWLCRQQLQVVVSLGGVESRLTVATGRECFVTCEGHGNRLFQLHVEHESGDGGLIFSNKQSEFEPLVLAGVPATAVGEQVKVRVERREPPIRALGLARNKTSKQ